MLKKSARLVLALFNYEKKYLIEILISVSVCVCVYWKIDEKVRLNFRSISTFIIDQHSAVSVQGILQRASVVCDFQDRPRCHRK